MKKIRHDPDSTFFTSDTHYNHASIVLGATHWTEIPYAYEKWPSVELRHQFSMENGLRDFASVEKMNETLVNGINQVVGAEDTLFCLGDWSFGGIESIKCFRDKIICKNIHLILGNHDHHIEDSEKGLQTLFASVSSYKEIRVAKQRIVLSHYAHRMWNGSHFGAWHLYGHSHSNLEVRPHGKSMDVGVDNAYKLLGEYRPFSFREIFSFLDKREILFLDHHREDRRSHEF